MGIWVGDNVSIEDLNEKSQACLNENLGIEMTELTPTSLKGRMPVDKRTTQPAGVLHGGASVAFAETLASWAGYLAIDRTRFHPVGQEINANHIRPASAGTWVYGEATPANIGRRAHVWEIKITNEEGKLVCISRCTLAIIEAPSQYTTADQRG
jgi:1,4-dihydroxy-2-naphthoyl-CoA hydrolase